jgi:hypothetical protein
MNHELSSKGDTVTPHIDISIIPLNVKYLPTVHLLFQSLLNHIATLLLMMFALPSFTNIHTITAYHNVNNKTKTHYKYERCHVK